MNVTDCPEFEIKSECTGCGLCSALCPTAAIHLVPSEDAGHFFIPNVENEKCIRCGLCTKRCPVLNKARLSGPAITAPTAWAFQRKEKDRLSLSSSGGFFLFLAEETIKKGGAAYGAAWTESLQVRHIRVTEWDDLPLLAGSKYIQSHIAKGVYLQLKSDVSSGMEVLFSGTPCQCAAVSLLFGGKRPDNLIVVDILCHGVPSQWAFDQWVRYEQARKGRTITGMNFRYRNLGGGKLFRYTYTSSRGDGEVVSSAAFSTFHRYFLESRTYRESCYSCAFRGERSFSDYSIGDIWWRELIDHPLPDDGAPPSMVFANSDRGKGLLEQIGAAGHFAIPFSEYRVPASKNKAFFSDEDRSKRSDAFLHDIEDFRNYGKYRLSPVKTILLAKMKTAIKCFLSVFGKRYEVHRFYYRDRLLK